MALWYNLKSILGSCVLTQAFTLFSLVWGVFKTIFHFKQHDLGLGFLFVHMGGFFGLFCFELLSVVYPVFMLLVTTDQFTLAHHMGDIFRISFRINTRIILVFYLPELCAPLNR